MHKIYDYKTFLFTCLSIVSFDFHYSCYFYEYVFSFENGSESKSPIRGKKIQQILKKSGTSPTGNVRKTLNFYSKDLIPNKAFSSNLMIYR